MFNFLRNIGTTEVIVIGIILLVFFGSKKIAEFGKNAGEATKEIKKIKKEVVEAKSEISREMEEV